MLELPESNTEAQQLTRTLSGKIIRRVAANASPHKFAWYSGDPQDYPARLEGLQIGPATAPGGWVEIQAEDMRIAFHDGANLRFLAPEAKRPAKHQLLLEFEDGCALACSIQMYGGIYAFRAVENDKAYYLSARSGCSPLTDAFTPACFERLISGVKPTASAKALLATEQRIPGLGNGVLQDILFHAGVHPARKVKTFTDETIDLLYHSVKETLFDMLIQGGRDTEKDIFGDWGGYRTRLSSKTWKQPCPKCGAAIVRKAYLGGNVYFCPVCQPENPD
ncbi:MAG: endonuclease VIII [Clostridiales bacterium]|nr:endonuclease VIII [Clostridiales bacterium]